MPDRLATMRIALARISDEELEALQRVTDSMPSKLPLGLLAYIAEVCRWELHRRCGDEFALTNPYQTIAAADIVVSRETTVVSEQVSRGNEAFADCSTRWAEH